MSIKSSLIIALLVFFVQNAWAQKRDTAGLQRAAHRLTEALVHKEERTLKKILSKNVRYAHSNGWTESRKEVIEDLFNGKLAYVTIKPWQEKWTVNGKKGLVRSKAEYDVIMSKQLLHFKLDVTQVWQWKRGKWILMSRQSVRLNEI
jgi:hypothetical protein